MARQRPSMPHRVTPAAWVAWASVTLAACGWNRPLPRQQEDGPAAIDQSFQKPLPALYDKRLAKWGEADAALAEHASTSLVALAKDDAWLLSHGADGSTLIAAKDRSVTLRKSPVTVAGAAFTVVLADGNLWYAKDGSVYRTTADAATLAREDLEALPAAELILHEDIRDVERILGAGDDYLMVQSAKGVIAHLRFDAGQVVAHKINLVPQFTRMSEPMLGAGLLRDRNGYWFMRGPYVAILKAMANAAADGKAQYLWQLYENNAVWPEAADVRSVAMNLGQTDGLPDIRGEIAFLTDKGLFLSQPAADLKLTWEADANGLAKRFCADCHAKEDKGLYEKGQWLARKDEILRRLAPDAPDGVRMPPKGVPGWNEDARRMLVLWLSGPDPQ